MKTKNIFWGLFFIAAAVLIVINQMGIVTNFSFFKAAGGILLFAVAIKGCTSRCFGVILFPLALIAILFAKELGIQALTPWPILAVALCATIGLSIMFPRKNKFSKYSQFSCCSSSTIDSDAVIIEDTEKNNFNSETGCSKSADNDSNDESFIKCSARFTSSIKYVNSDNFLEADLKAHFGAIKIFFDNARIQPGKQAVINIEAAFSGIEMFIPRDWCIENRMNTAFGAVEEKNHSCPNACTTVTLTGQANFCGIEITYI